MDKKKRGIVLQLTAAVLVLILAIITICIPRRTKKPTDATGVETVTYKLTDTSVGTLALADQTHPLTEAELARIGAECVPVEWYGSSYMEVHAGACLHPSALLQLERMLYAYGQNNASYSVPVLTHGFSASSTADPFGTGMALNLALRVPVGEVMSEVPLTSPLAGSFSAWLTSHAALYGFLFSDTGVLRFVGTPHAAYLFSQSISHAAYIELLMTKNAETPLLVETGGVTYAIFYVPADKDGEAQLTLPSGTVFTVSKTNTGGFIVTTVRE